MTKEGLIKCIPLLVMGWRKRMRKILSFSYYDMQWTFVKARNVPPRARRRKPTRRPELRHCLICWPGLASHNISTTQIFVFPCPLQERHGKSSHFLFTILLLRFRLLVSLVGAPVPLPWLIPTWPRPAAPAPRRALRAWRSVPRALGARGCGGQLLGVEAAGAGGSSMGGGGSSRCPSAPRPLRRRPWTRTTGQDPATWRLR
jgi:hypothetical protein